MRNLGILLIAVIALMVIGCQPPEGMGGVTQEQFDELKGHVEMLKADVENLHMALDSLTTHYNMHVEKYHKGAKTAPPTPAPSPPPRKGG
jgi:hypothetical protein